ncbi:MAG: ATP-dependent sacrificial sulfur transferase LarE [Bacteroidota bacterium]|nr:ATP-dependent sacrificial sulfur transferase LarE [Bacteroidota bacterium]
MNPELESKYSRLKTILKDLGSLIIAYSGGVDSTLLLKVAVDVLGKNVLAVIGRSDTYPISEYEEAIQFARSIGAEWAEIKTEETDNLKFKENPVDRCYFCKTELFTKLHQVAQQKGIQRIADGSITDDLSDFRPGMKAKKEQNVCSPLLEAGLSKADVRELSKQLGLPTWDKGSFACLSSRFPYGTAITKEALQQIDAAEIMLHNLGFRYYRVRYHDSKTARIEVGTEEIPRLMDSNLRNKIVADIKRLGFTYVTLDLQGYRTGSMNEILPNKPM